MCRDYENKKKYLTALGKKFKVACDQAKAAGKIKKYISGDGAEGAFHLEITQWIISKLLNIFSYLL